MQLRHPIGTLAAGALLALAPLAHAVTVNDPAGDYVAGFTGSKLGDLDVLSSFVTYNQGTDQFVFSGTMAADIGTTPGGFYVWGVNRGQGTAGFAANGLPSVLFDSVVTIRQDGSVTVTRTIGAGAGTPVSLAAGTAKFFGSTVIASFAGTALPSNGLAKTAYTWNLWPRDGTLSGFAAIADFAPDNTNVLVTVIGAVPEPATTALWATGIAALAITARRRQRR